MLSIQENEALTRVGKGTPMGDLMRRYWHPIAGTDELDDRPTKSVRILGEDLVLYRDRSGTYGLIDRLCAHRRVDLSYGIPEEQGLRCMYHGWMYDETGQCIEQPFEETVHPDGRFKEKVKLAAYPVEDRFGMLWAYMGPLPAPILPIWEPYSYDNGVANVAIVELPCNWLQCMENSLDPVHLEWLHGYWGEVQMREAKRKNGDAPELVPIIPKHHKKIGFSEFDNGIIKRRVAGENATEDDADWQVGHPAIFPNILYVGDMVKCNFQYRVPIDDYTTLHVTWFFYKSAPGVKQPKQTKIPSWRVPLFDADGALIPDLVNHQDFVAWITQGLLADRSLEKLGESDRGIIMYRKQLREQMDIATDGGDPMNVFRDPKAAEYIELPLERWPGLQGAERFTTYMSAQADEPPDQVAQIQMVLDSWAEQASV
jgi:5,5'-dehydrodivanillate O-demethylase